MVAVKLMVSVKNMKRTSSILLAVLLMITVNSNAFADHPVPPKSYSIVSSDRRFVFVMLAPTVEDDINLGSSAQRKRALRIRKRYRSSGLYSINGSRKPLWTIDWYASSVILPSGGLYVIRMGPWASTRDDEAFSFFKEGKILKTYRVKDLISNPAALPHSVSHFDWLKLKTLNPHQKTFTVTTLLNEKYVFDITTGNIMSRRSA
jgi:hypothetical protein